MVHRRRVAAIFTVTLLLAGCGGAGDEAPVPDEALVSGPLCDGLPRGTEPGAPALLATEPASVALTWIPVIMNFEASVRAAGLEEDLRDTQGVTIIAPTDEAFLAAMSQDTIDDLLLFRQDELRALLENHIIDGQLSLAEMEDAGTVTTRSGSEITVTPAGEGMLTLDGRSETICADYAVGNARIHVVDGMLGDMPEPAAVDPDIGG